MLLPKPHPHPWRRLRNLPHITVRYFGGQGPFGWCRHSTQEIFIREGLTTAERRATLAHELTHLERGPALRGAVARDERLTRIATARWLIPLENLADGLLWCGDDLELAEHLWVDLGHVRARLHSLTGAEDLLLNQRLDAAELRFPK